MRVTLTQTEIFAAIANFVRSKWKLDDTASLEIDITAGRTPKGYTADIEIIEAEKAEPALRCVAAQPKGDEDLDRDTTAATPSTEVTASTETTSDDVTAAGTKSADDIFN